MKVAIYTLTWNRLYYTQHCFAKLKELAGYDYQHIVVDNGSTDGTQEWLIDHQDEYTVIQNQMNMGLAHGIKQALEQIDADLIIKFDNDCEVVTPDIIKLLVDFYKEHGDDYIVSPKIWGLNHPPKTIERVIKGNWLLDRTNIIGGIFQPVPRKHLDLFLRSKHLEDSSICDNYVRHGLFVGYLTDIEANHFETTNGQLERYGEKVGYKY